MYYLCFMKGSSVRLETHIDGEWFTSNHNYKNRKICIKMKPNKGCKIHIWNPEGTKVEKTFRFNFSTEEYLLNKAKTWIDKKS